MRPVSAAGRLFFAVGFAILVGAAYMATGCDDSSSVKEPTADAGSRRDSGADGAVDPDGGKDCFDNPKTHFEIINACTTATRITKNPTSTKLLPDGGLPPLD